MTVGAEGLGCYTANLGQYLEGCREGALGRVARTVRLAVRTDLPAGALAFSHHAVGLDRVDGESRLAYASHPDPSAALDGIAAELAAHGQVLAVTNTATMAWSAAGPDRPAPHFLRIDRKRGRAWHVDDRFTAQLPEGEQKPFTGWIGEDALRRSLTPIVPLPVHQRLRNRYAFGLPVELPPPGEYQWLVRTWTPARAEDLDGRWLTRIDAVLDLLEGFWSELDAWPDRARHLDDMWAAAQHHTFRYAHLRAELPAGDPAWPILDRAERAWRDLPMALDFAARTVRRGRPRPGVVKTTFAHLRQAELAGHRVAAAHGYTER